MWTRWLVLLAGLSAGFAVACGGEFNGPTESRDASFPVGSSPNVVVSGDNGHIIVNSGAVDTVRVQATLRKPDDLDYKAVQEGGVINVEAKTKGRGIFHFGSSPGADIEITAPPNTRVELQTSNGEIELYGMRESGKVHTSNGKIVLGNVTGNFEISTSNGDVAISGAAGSFDVETSNGRIEFDGELTPGGNNRLKTSNGSVEVKLQGTPSVELDASTSNGSITNDLPILVTTSNDEHHVAGTIGDGDAELSVRTSNGSVTIR